MAGNENSDRRPSRVESPKAMTVPEKVNFTFPHEVVDDPSLNETQKRAILAAWASDACVIEAFPTLRRFPGTTHPVTLSSVLDALRQLDRKLRRFDEDLVQNAIVAQFAKKKFHNSSPRS